jgi:coenzyme F420-0:L-glutamate ligase/coenzyme F420-1:gamma-L-glutamate ligase
LLQIFPIPNLPIFQPNDDIAKIITKNYGPKLKENDILVIAHTIVSRVENCEVEYEKINPSPPALDFAKSSEKDPRIVEVVLREARSVVRKSDTLLITETRHGFICANSGVDRSNARPGYVLTLPVDPDKSAKRIKENLQKLTNLNNLIIIISDTFGRPFRIGTTNIAIGVAGIEPILDFTSKKDLFNYELQHTSVAVADELASAAGLSMGQSNEGTPVVIIRGYNRYIKSSNSTATNLNRKKEDALFW